MARQKGVLKYVGTLGDVRHFKIKGQEGDFAGMVGGPSGEQVLSAPEFENTCHISFKLLTPDEYLKTNLPVFGITSPSCSLAEVFWHGNFNASDIKSNQTTTCETEKSADSALVVEQEKTLEKQSLNKNGRGQKSILSFFGAATK